MPYRDLREFISLLEKEGEIVRVKAEVDPHLEVGTIMRKVFDKRGKGVLFENVKGHTIPLLSGVMDTYKRYALAIDCPSELRAILNKTLNAARNPILPQMVKKGPCQEKVLTGGQVDLSHIPVPYWHHLDGGPFIGTLGVVISKDPETGSRNCGVYREQILGKNKTGLLATQQVGVTLKKYRDRGQAMPVATAIGVEPALLAASCFHLPFGNEEYGAAGALMEEPVPLVKCKT